MIIFARDDIQTAQLEHIRILKIEKAQLREALESMVRQFGSWSDGCLTTGGLSALVDAFMVLGWDDPHPMPDMQCEEPGCKKQSSCGWPSPSGYRRTCGEHMK